MTPGNIRRGGEVTSPNTSQRFCFPNTLDQTSRLWSSQKQLFFLRELFLLAALLPLYETSPPVDNSPGTTGGQLRIGPQKTLNGSKEYTNATKFKLTPYSVFLSPKLFSHVL